MLFQHVDLQKQLFKSTVSLASELRLFSASTTAMLDPISFETRPKWGGIPVCFPDDKLGLPYRLRHVKI